MDVITTIRNQLKCDSQSKHQSINKNDKIIRIIRIKMMTTRTTTRWRMTTMSENQHRRTSSDARVSDEVWKISTYLYKSEESEKAWKKIPLEIVSRRFSCLVELFSFGAFDPLFLGPNREYRHHISWILFSSHREEFSPFSRFGWLLGFESGLSRNMYLYKKFDVGNIFHGYKTVPSVPKMENTPQRR